MHARWRLLLLGSATIAATALAATSFETTTIDPTIEGTIARLRKEIRPWNFYWDSYNDVTDNGSPHKEHVRQTAQRSTRSYRKTIIFVRHGQYRVKAPTRDEKVLTDLGWRQAYATGCYLRSLGIRIDRIVHSNLIRARQTTAALLIGLLDDSERLFDVPTLANLTASYQTTLQGNYAAATGNEPSRDPLCSRTGIQDNTDFCVVSEPYRPFSDALFDCQESGYLAEGPPPVAPQPPGASSTSDKVRATEGRRLDDGFRVHINSVLLTHSDRILGDHSGPGSEPMMHSCSPCWQSNACDCPCHRDGQCETILFVGHANVFRYWLCRALQLPPEAWLRIQLYHGSVSWLELDFESDAGLPPRVGPWSVVKAARIGEVGHMPKELLSR